MTQGLLAPSSVLVGTAYVFRMYLRTVMEGPAYVQGDTTNISLVTVQHTRPWDKASNGVETPACSSSADDLRYTLMMRVLSTTNIPETLGTKIGRIGDHSMN